MAKTKKMTTEEIKAAIDYGKATIKQYKAEGEEVPEWVYERMMRLYDELVKNL